MESKSLNLWKQQLGTLPASTWDNPALETLILADNGLTTLPDGIGELTSLRTLDLGHNGNPFTELPPWTVEWVNLQKLDLRWVKLSSIPAAIGVLEDRGGRVLL